jgi:hypothetical protein
MKTPIIGAIALSIGATLAVPTYAADLAEMYMGKCPWSDYLRQMAA